LDNEEGASNSLWASHCSRFTDENILIKRIFVWRLDGGRWFIPTLLSTQHWLQETMKTNLRRHHYGRHASRNGWIWSLHSTSSIYRHPHHHV